MEDKIKVQVMVNADAVARIDKLAHDMGMSRSALCCYWIGQGLAGHAMAIKASSEFIHLVADNCNEMTDELVDLKLRNDMK